MREKNGESKGVGFARIDNNKLCYKIIQELNGQPFPGNLISLNFYLLSRFDQFSIIIS